MMTITQEQQAAITAKLNGMTLPSGLGDEDNACSIAAINLAMSGQLTDKIPDCMSLVIGKWIIPIQDAMPDELRNSPRWKALLPRAAGTGRDNEQERLTVIMDWMWGTVLPSMQPLADKHGFGAEWQHMTAQRTAAAAGAAWAAAAAAGATANAAAWASAVVAGATNAADAAANAAVVAAAANAAAAAVVAAAVAERAMEAWNQFDPCGLLERLIAVGE